MSGGRGMDPHHLAHEFENSMSATMLFSSEASDEEFKLALLAV
jgi:hypothetical protein